MPERDYPYLRAWEQMMHSSEKYLNQRLALAHKDNAPQDAMWRSISGKWHLFSEMTEHNPNRLLIMAYADLIAKGGAEDETV